MFESLIHSTREQNLWNKMFKIDCHINSENLKKKKSYNRANSMAFQWIKRVIYDCSGHHGMAHHVLFAKTLLSS